MALDLDVLDLGVLLENGSNLVEQRIADLLDHGLVKVELDLLQNHNLLIRDVYNGAAVLLRIRVSHAFLVGTSVLVVENAVAVAIRRAAVLLRIGIGYAFHVGARVLVIRNAVLVAIRRTTILVRISIGRPLDIRARVLLISDPVLIAIRRAAV